MKEQPDSFSIFTYICGSLLINVAALFFVVVFGIALQFNAIEYWIAGSIANIITVLLYLMCGLNEVFYSKDKSHRCVVVLAFTLALISIVALTSFYGNKVVFHGETLWRNAILPFSINDIIASFFFHFVNEKVMTKCLHTEEVSEECSNLTEEQ